jgi:hypothetical protein
MTTESRKFDSPADILDRINEFCSHLEGTPYKNVEVSSTNKYNLLKKETTTGALIDIDAGYVEDEEDYHERVAYLTDLCNFSFEKNVSDAFTRLQAKSGNIRMVVYIWMEYNFKEDEGKFLEFLSKISGCTMVRKEQYHKAYTSSSIVCELK